MANEIHQGERLAVAGPLKEGQTVVTSYALSCQVFSNGKLVKEIPMTVDTTSNYYCCSIDTSKIIGQIAIRFVAKDSGQDIVVSNGWIHKTIIA